MSRSRIIKDLANGDTDALTALKRAKVLLSELDNDDINKWVNYEISGYPDEENPPGYRKETGNLKGYYVVGTFGTHVTYKNTSIPLGKMPIDMQNKLLTVEFREGVGALKQLLTVSQANQNVLEKPIPADFYPIISKYNENPFMSIVSAHVVIGAHVLQNIFSTVENKLLDVFLALEKEFENLDDLDIDISTKSDEQIKTINNQITMIIFTDNSVSIGDNNRITKSTISSESKSQ